MPYCEGCGNKLGEAASFCHHCGRKVARATAVAPPAAPATRPGPPRALLPVAVAVVLAALLVAIVLGSLGRKAPVVYTTETGIYMLMPGAAQPKRVADADHVLWAAPSPNGRWVAFVTGGERGHRLTLCTLQGKVVKDSDDSYLLGKMQWTPHSSGVLALRYRQGERSELAYYDLAKESQPEVLVSSSDEPVAFRCSPDGRWLAYASSGDGGGLWLAPLRANGERKRVADDEVNEYSSPEWLSADQLLYREDDGDMRTYSVRSGEHRTLLDRDTAQRLSRSFRWIAALSRDRMIATVIRGSEAQPDAVEMEMERGDGAHYFRMELRQGTSYAVAARGSAVRLELLDENDGVLARGSEDKALDLVLATYTSDRDRSVSIRVRPPESDSSARYTLWAVSDQGEERGGSPSGPSRTLTKTGLVPQDSTFTFRGRGGGWVDAYVSSDEFDTVLSLYSGQSASGSTLARNDDFAGSRNSRISMQLPSTGWYSLRVDAYGNRFANPFASSGRFSLRVEGSGILLNPTSQADAWPLVPQAGGLWAASVPLEKLGSEPLPMRLLAPAAQGLSRAVASGVSTCALVYRTGEGSPVQVALLRSGQSPRVISLDALPRAYPVRAVWDADGSSLLISLVQRSAGESNGSELWLVPVSRPGQAKHVASGVRYVSSSSPDDWLQ